MRWAYILGGIAILGFAGALAANAYDVAPDSLGGLKRRFREYFDVAPDCSSIAFKQGLDAEEFWGEVAGPLLDAMVSLLSPATSDPDEITRITLTYIFPTCPWPAPDDRPDLLLLEHAVLAAVQGD